MKLLAAIIIGISIISCGIEEKEALLEIPDSYNFMLEQRASRLIKGTEEAIRVKIGDITGGKVEVKVSGEDDKGEGKIYMDRVMREGDRGTFDYHGTPYTLEIEELVNKLIGEDHAQIAIFKGSVNGDGFQPEVN